MIESKRLLLPLHGNSWQMNRIWLPLGVVSELLAIMMGRVELSYLSCGFFLLYFSLSFPRLEWYSRLLALATVAILAVVMLVGKMTPERVADAAESAAFYAAFLGSLGLMNALVRRLEVLRRIHDVLLGGRPEFLYPKYVLTSCGVSSVLSFGVMHVLCGSLSETLDQRGIEGSARVNWVRSLLIATLRGFALVPLIAPTSVALAILAREVPDLSWSTLLPYTACAAVLFLLAGAVLERRRFKEISSQRVQLDGIPGGTWTLVIFVSILLAGMALLVSLADLKVSQAAMLLVPVMTLVYLLIKERKPRALIKEVANNMEGQRNEMCIFASSAAMGGILASLVPTELIDPELLTPQWEMLIATVGLLLLPLGAAIGIAPIAVMSFLAGVLAQLQILGLSPLTTGVALSIGFSLAMMLSPFGPSVMILSRMGRVSKYIVAFNWNGMFTLASLPLMLALLAVLVW